MAITNKDRYWAARRALELLRQGRRGDDVVANELTQRGDSITSKTVARWRYDRFPKESRNVGSLSATGSDILREDVASEVADVFEDGPPSCQSTLKPNVEANTSATSKRRFRGNDYETDTEITTHLLREGEFRDLFIEKMGWDITDLDPVEVPESDLEAIAVADKKGMGAWRVDCPGGLPIASEQHRVVRAVKQVSRDALLVFTTEDEHMWIWPEEQSGGRYRLVRHQYDANRPNEQIVQCLGKATFKLSEEGQLTSSGVLNRVRSSFNADSEENKPTPTANLSDGAKANRAAPSPPQALGEPRPIRPLRTEGMDDEEYSNTYRAWTDWYNQTFVPAEEMEWYGFVQNETERNRDPHLPVPYEMLSETLNAHDIEMGILELDDTIEAAFCGTDDERDTARNVLKDAMDRLRLQWTEDYEDLEEHCDLSATSGEGPPEIEAYDAINNEFTRWIGEGRLQAIEHIVGRNHLPHDDVAGHICDKWYEYQDWWAQNYRHAHLL